MMNRRLGIGITAVTLILALVSNIALAQAADQAGSVAMGRLIGAGVAFGLAAGGAGVGIGLIGAAAVGAIIERRDLLGLYLVFIALAEAVALYGFAMAFIILTYSV
jgi:V/A-type H+-transporting ATPase subunit K